MLEARAICETCGHTREWHDREAIRARLRADPPVERPCYREIGGSPCPCGGFRDSGTLVVPAGSLSMRGAAPGLAIARIAVVALLLVVVGLGLLYAYRSQAPSVPEVDIGRALQDINAGRIRAVTISANKATLDQGQLIAQGTGNPAGAGHRHCACRFELQRRALRAAHRA